MWFPSLRSWGQALLFIILTSLVIYSLSLLKLDNYLSIQSFTRVEITTRLIVTLFLLITVPILIYGGSHYILFGKGRRLNSAIEGLWMGFILFGYIGLISGYILLKALIISYYSGKSLFYSLIYHPPSRIENNLSLYLLILFPAYCYHWRALLIGWGRRRIKKNRDSK